MRFLFTALLIISSAAVTLWTLLAVVPYHLAADSSAVPVLSGFVLGALLAVGAVYVGTSYNTIKD